MVVGLEPVPGLLTYLTSHGSTGSENRGSAGPAERNLACLSYDTVAEPDGAQHFLHHDKHGHVDAIAYDDNHGHRLVPPRRRPWPRRPGGRGRQPAVGGSRWLALSVLAHY